MLRYMSRPYPFMNIWSNYMTHLQWASNAAFLLAGVSFFLFYHTNIFKHCTVQHNVVFRYKIIKIENINNEPTEEDVDMQFTIRIHSILTLFPCLLAIILHAEDNLILKIIRFYTQEFIFGTH
jgi:hypothetical protein